jgi:hypothetical protein
MPKSFAAGALLIALLVASTTRADVVVPPSQPFNGTSQAGLANGFWQWAFSFPSASNPLLDTTGAFSSLGNEGQFFYLAGTTGNTSASRTATVGSDQYLFVPVLPVITFGDISAYQPPTYANLRRDDAETVGIQPDGSAPNTKLFVTLDGKPVPLPVGTTSLLDFRQFSPALFDLFIPADNLFASFGVTGPQTTPAVADGWYVLLAPLSPGTHTLSFGGETTGIGAYDGQMTFTSTTYTLDVVPVPEPSSLALLALGGGALAGWRRWKKRATA